MKSRVILTIHFVLFLFFNILFLATPFIARAYPAVSGWVYLGTTLALIVLLQVAWKKYGGCPFTTWENEYRAQEGRPQYEGSCIRHYTAQWFGIMLPERSISVFLMATPMVPIAVGLIKLL